MVYYYHYWVVWGVEGNFYVYFVEPFAELLVFLSGVDCDCDVDVDCGSDSSVEWQGVAADDHV